MPGNDSFPTKNQPGPTKIHMKVKCHCSAPPSHPPMVSALGTVSKLCCGIFGPKLGNALKIFRPEPMSTNSEIALSQWQILTTHGCSQATGTTSPLTSTLRVSSLSPDAIVLTNTIP